MKGKFIVFEGLDGSGKATQTRLLTEHLRRQGFEIEKIDFPQHGTKSSGMVDNYLTGRYGTAEQVGPWRGSIFYAVDRYDASFKIKQWLSSGKIVIADRYLASNMGHQGGKIKDEEQRKKYFEWLYELEYSLFKIPKPDITFILKTSPELSLKMANDITDKTKKETRKSYLGDDKKQDIHEKDKLHQEATLQSYLQAAKEFPNEFKIIECVENNQLLPSLKIHETIWKIIKQEISI